MTWAFFLMLVLADGETREVRFKGYASWQACEDARIEQLRKPVPDGVDGRVIRACTKLERVSS